MGKVYDALKMSGGYIDDSGGIARGARRVSEARDYPEPEPINYLDYLLNGVPVLESEAPARPGQLALARPVIDVARSVTVDVSRIDRHLVAFSGSSRFAVEQYNRLAVALISAASGRSLKRVLVGSAARGEGRTSVALNLACTLARARKKVLLVDGDLSKPSIMRMLAIEADLGLGEIFRWTNPGSALLKLPRFGFDVLPTRSRVENSAEVLSSKAFNMAIGLLDEHYDYILFDTTPLLEAADCNLLMKIADTMVMVIRAGRLKTSDLSRAVERLKPEDVFGVVLNRGHATMN
jgi:capsular exopolysaccharide synthesis family protein